MCRLRVASVRLYQYAALMGSLSLVEAVRKTISLKFTTIITITSPEAEVPGDCGENLPEILLWLVGDVSG